MTYAISETTKVCTK